MSHWLTVASQGAERPGQQSLTCWGAYIRPPRETETLRQPSAPAPECHQTRVAAVGSRMGEFSHGVSHRPSYLALVQDLASKGPMLSDQGPQ